MVERVIRIIPTILISVLTTMPVVIRAELKVAPLPAKVVMNGASNEPPQATQCEPISVTTVALPVLVNPFLLLRSRNKRTISRILTVAKNEKIAKDSERGSSRLEKVLVKD